MGKFGLEELSAICREEIYILLAVASGVIVNARQKAYCELQQNALAKADKQEQP
jgi:hypothetical protein